jgi:hypothetical protein
LREGEGVANEILDWFGATPEKLRAALADLPIEPPQAPPREDNVVRQRGFGWVVAPCVLVSVAVGVLIGWLIWA